MLLSHFSGIIYVSKISKKNVFISNFLVIATISRDSLMSYIMDGNRVLCRVCKREVGLMDLNTNMVMLIDVRECWQKPVAFSSEILPNGEEMFISKNRIEEVDQPFWDLPSLVSVTLEDELALMGVSDFESSPQILEQINCGAGTSSAITDAPHKRAKRRLNFPYEKKMGDHIDEIIDAVARGEIGIKNLNDCSAFPLYSLF